jgi:hypothetical protein
LFATFESVTGFLAVAGALIVLALVIVRLIQASGPMRRVLWPVLFGALVGNAAFAFNVLSFSLGTGTPLAATLGRLLSVARATVPVGFLVGLLRMRMDKAAVAELVVSLHGGRPSGSLQHSIASALHDPSVTLGYWSPAAAAYVDGTGRRSIETGLPPPSTPRPRTPGSCPPVRSRLGTPPSRWVRSSRSSGGYAITPGPTARPCAFASGCTGGSRR